MSRLKRLKRSEVSGEVREIFEQVAAQRGNIPNLYRVFAHRPEILKTIVAHLDTVTKTGTVPMKTKELVATLVSRLNHCDY